MNDPIVFLPLTQGQVAIIDFADFEKVGRVKWCAHKRGDGGNFHAQRRVDGKLVYLHNVLLEVKGVDHKNGNGLDCRRENMRPATRKQNAQAFQRKAPNKTSCFRGVRRHSQNPVWTAQIKMGDKHFYLGSFKLEKDAAIAYDKKAVELGFFKEALNFL